MGNRELRMGKLLDRLPGYPVLGIWYWCADQTIVQRVIAAQTLRDAKIKPDISDKLQVRIGRITAVGCHDHWYFMVTAHCQVR